jgi:predicted DNA-binding transcriptional regulator AlpA
VSELLTSKELMSHLKISSATYHRMRRNGLLPPHIKLGNGQVRFDTKDVEMWKVEHKITNQAPPVPVASLESAD